MQSIQPYHFHHKKALIRVDFNVPLDGWGQITDSTRIDRSLPTIRKVLDDGGAAILLSHLGRPGGVGRPKFSLVQLRPYLQDKLGMPVLFIPDHTTTQARKKIAQLQPGQVMLLENMRFYAGEMTGDRLFAQALAALGDVYVQDALSVCHRTHASVAVTPLHCTDRVMGCLLAEELRQIRKLSTAMANKPFTAIVGGFKVTDKIQALHWLSQRADNMLLGGVLANTFHQALGTSLGDSCVSDEQVRNARALYNLLRPQVNLVLPTDAVVVPHADQTASATTAQVDAIPAGYSAVDIGPASRQTFSDIIAASHTILWIGSVGAFEKHQEGTQAIAKAIAHATQQGAFSCIGGGDTGKAIRKLGYADNVSYVSTAGGALLAYMQDSNLPGLAALAGSLY